MKYPYSTLNVLVSSDIFEIPTKCTCPMLPYKIYVYLYTISLTSRNLQLYRLEYQLNIHSNIVLWIS